MGNVSAREGGSRVTIRAAKAARGARRAGFVIRCAVACRYLRLALPSGPFSLSHTVIKIIAFGDEALSFLVHCAYFIRN